MPGMFELMFSVLLSLLCIFVVFRSHRLSERLPRKNPVAFRAETIIKVRISGEVINEIQITHINAHCFLLAPVCHPLRGGRLPHNEQSGKTKRKG